MAASCLRSLKACYSRFTELNASGAIIAGPTGMYYSTTDLVTLTWEPNILEGEVKQRKNACGTICSSQSEDDQIQWLDVTLELCNANGGVYDLLIGADVLGTNNGWALPASNTGLATYVAIEVWTKNVSSQAVVDGTNAWQRWLLPRVRLVPQSREFNDDFLVHTFTGKAFDGVAGFDGTKLATPTWTVASTRAIQMNETNVAPSVSATCALVANPV